MKVIYGAAGLFVLLALWTAWQAFLLVPTDLGNSYLVATSVLFSTAGLLVGLGIVGQRVIREIRDRDQPLQVAVAPHAPSVTTMAPEPVVHAPAMPEPAPAPVVPPPSRSVAPVLAGAAAGVAAGAVAGSALGGNFRAAPETAADNKMLDELERDLFADLHAPARMPELPESAKPEPEFVLPPVTVRDWDEAAPVAAEPVLSELPPMDDIVLGEPEDSALPPPPREIAADTGEDDDLVLPPLPPLPSFGLPEPTPSEAEIRAIEDAAHADDDRDDVPATPMMAELRFEPAIDVVPEPVAQPEPEPEPLAPEPVSPTPGLIHDEDLAALSDAVADLAPLETLDVVGAYDSGGTRFTMYSDGSVTAKGEGVDRRFRSLDDLRAFIDGGMRG